MRHRHLNAALVGVLALCVSPTAARAESIGPTCAYYGVTAVPLEGQSIPANAPALALEGVSSELQGWTLSDVAVLDPDGQPVAVSLEADSASDLTFRSYTLVRLTEPMVEGKGYTLRWTATCNAGYPAGPFEGKRVFDIGPPVAFPTSIGTITRYLPSDGEYPVVVQLSPEALAFTPVAIVQVVSPGQTGYDGYGSWTAESKTLSFFKECTTTGPVEKTFELRYHLAGALEDPPSMPFVLAYECESFDLPEPMPEAVLKKNLAPLTPRSRTARTT
jgi:hypothetical protein